MNIANFINIYTYTYVCVYTYTKIKKPKTRCVGVNIKQKNTFSIVKNICRSLCKITEIFVTLENVFFCLIYIYIYIYIYTYTICDKSDSK